MGGVVLVEESYFTDCFAHLGKLRADAAPADMCVSGRPMRLSQHSTAGGAIEVEFLSNATVSNTSVVVRSSTFFNTVGSNGGGGCQT